MGVERGFETKCLDHGYVRYVDSMGTDEDIISAARMSTGKGFLGWEPGRHCKDCFEPYRRQDEQYPCVALGRNHAYVDHKGDANLLEFLYRNSHHTPFEMPRLIVEVYAPLFIFREWMRHRQWSYNEFSARYAQMPNEHYVPAVERFEPKVSANKQESSAHAAILAEDRREGWRKVVYDEQAASYSDYEAMINAGVPKEIARINTPVSRYSKMRAGVSLRGALDFLVLRDHPAAQLEMQQYAKAFGSIVKELWPRTYALFEEYTLGAVTLSRSDLLQLREKLIREDQGILGFALSEDLREKFK